MPNQPFLDPVRILRDYVAFHEGEIAKLNRAIQALEGNTSVIPTFEVTAPQAPRQRAAAAPKSQKGPQGPRKESLSQQLRDAITLILDPENPQTPKEIAGQLPPSLHEKLETSSINVSHILTKSFVKKDGGWVLPMPPMSDFD